MDAASRKERADLGEGATFRLLSVSTVEVDITESLEMLFVFATGGVAKPAGKKANGRGGVTSPGRIFEPRGEWDGGDVSVVDAVSLRSD